jgi:ferredoxin-type protein NapH
MKMRQKLRRAATVATAALFPVTLYYFSPILSIQGLAAGILAGSVAMFALLFVLSLFLGRAFCAWVCPAGAVQELVRGFGGRPVNRLQIRWIKWVIWTPWVLALVLMVFRAGGIHAVDLTWRTVHGFSVTDMPGAIALVSVLTLFSVLALAVGRRTGCHTVCWMAPFMILGREIRNIFGWPALRLATDANRCNECGTCTRNCPMSIGVTALVKSSRTESSDCILCASCVDGCPRGAIRVTYSSGL